MSQTITLTGDCIDSMQSLSEGSVHCCITSPPYWGLRDYGMSGQIGTENTVDEYVAKLVDVFREVRRILREDGTAWLNLGDTYGKGKQLCGIPWRVALALQEDGWILRQDIIWHKPNPMPESVKDRCTKSHEYIFLLSKGEKYYYDADSIRTESTSTGPSWKDRKKAGEPMRHGLKGAAACGAGGFASNKLGANKRSVWKVVSGGYKGAHFATFPPDLIRPCVLAGCPEDGTIIDPFGGAGTTAIVASEHNRSSILCELNPEYVELSNKRQVV